MNKKGFTLVELIVTIALLAIIAVIAFVSINKVINDNKNKNCESLVSSIVVATKEYASDNRYNSTFINRVDNKYELTIDGQELLNNNYLNGEIVNPYDKSIIAPSDVTIHIYLDTDYTVRAVLVDNPSVLSNCNCQTTPSEITIDTPPYVDDGSDITPPVITYSLSGGEYKGLSYQVTITASDAESGIDYMGVYVYNNGVLISEKSNDHIIANSYIVNLDKYNDWKILTKAYDKAGNRSNQEPQTDDGKYYQEYRITGKPIYIYYSVNGGKLKSGSKCARGDEGDKTCVLLKDYAAVKSSSGEKEYAYQVCKYDKKCNLWNYNNADYLNITRSGYIAKSGNQWNTKAKGTGKSLDQTQNYTYEKIVSLAQEKENNYKLNVYVNWEEEPTTDSSGGDGGGSSSTSGACKFEDIYYCTTFNPSFQTTAQCSGTSTINNYKCKNSGDVKSTTVCSGTCTWSCTYKNGKKENGSYSKSKIISTKYC